MPRVLSRPALLMHDSTDCMQLTSACLKDAAGKELVKVLNCSQAKLTHRQQSASMTQLVSLTIATSMPSIHDAGGLHTHLLEGASAVCRILPNPAVALPRAFAAGLLLSASVVHRLCMLPKPGLLEAVLFAVVLELFECVAKSRPERSRLERPAEEAWLRALLLIVLALLLGNEGSFDATTVPDGDARAEACVGKMLPLAMQGICSHAKHSFRHFGMSL